MGFGRLAPRATPVQVNDTTSRSLTLGSRPRGHWYSFRVQAADRRGNLSKWTSATRIWVP